jgi:hypothetical protein
VDHVSRHTNHRDPRAIGGQLEALAERILVGPVAPPDRRADDRNRDRLEPIGVVEPVERYLVEMKKSTG